MVCIKSVGSALPENVYNAEDIQKAGEVWLGNTPEKELFNRFVRSSDTGNRYFARPIAEVLEMGGQSQRAEIFEKEGVKLGAASARDAIEKANISVEDLSSYVFTSCSCPVIPSIDALIIDELEISRNVSRVPVYQFGCAGGVSGLSLAAKLVKDDFKVMLTSVELCTLVYQRNDLSVGNLVGSAIFGDGSASVVLSNEEEGMTFVDSSSFLIPNTRHLMGYNIYDDGAHLRLDKDLPNVLSSIVVDVVSGFLAKNGLGVKDIKHWLFHPGGKKIVDQLQSVFSLEDERCYWSRKILSQYGNLSSSTILFVIKDYLESKEYQKGDYVVVMGIGPGLTVETILFQFV